MSSKIKLPKIAKPRIAIGNGLALNSETAQAITKKGCRGNMKLAYDTSWAEKGL